MKIPGLYKKYHVDKQNTSIGLFRELNTKFNIESVFYPGSHVHISPSLIFANVCYADSFRNTHKFFEDKETIEFIKKNKEYLEDPVIRFYQQDYNKSFKELSQEFDLVISQYAGFVGQAAKPYLKKGGLLVCNNSHGDASMANLDPDFELVAIYRRRTDNKFSISDKKLKEFLIPKNGFQPSKDQLIKSMRGIAYTKSPSGYILSERSSTSRSSEWNPVSHRPISFAGNTRRYPGDPVPLNHSCTENLPHKLI